MVFWMSLIKYTNTLAFSLLLSTTLSAAEFVVDTTQDSVDVSPGDGNCATQSGKCSLRAAVMEANKLAGADSIKLPDGEYRLTLGNTDEDAAAEGDFDLYTDITITGSGIGETIINGSANEFRLFHIFVPDNEVIPNVRLESMSLTQGLEDENGAVILNNKGNLFLSNIEVYEAGLGSNAVYSYYANTSIEDSRFTKNARAVFSTNSKLEVADSVFTGNGGSGSSNSGAAISASYGTTNISGSEFSENATSRSDGAAMYSRGGTLTIDDSDFAGNTAGNSSNYRNAGALVINSSDTIISNSTFSDNNAYRNAGAIYIAGGNPVYISNSKFSNNEARTQGGGIYTASSNVRLYINNSELTNNKALNEDGGAIYQYYLNSLVRIEASTLSNNSAGDVGGAIASGVVELVNSVLFDNTADYGGAVFTSGTGSEISNTTISGNSASVSGGGLYYKGYRDDYRIDINNSTIAFNLAANGRAGNIFNAAGRIRLARTIVSDSKTGINCEGEISTLGHNLDSDGSCGMNTGTDKSEVSPLLAALADNGGPTLTHAPSADSPVVNQIVVDICPDVDQRYHYRKLENGNCDIGAFETGSEEAESGTLAFSSGQYSANEVGGTATLRVKRTGGTQGQVSIDYKDLYTGTASSVSYRDYESIISDTLYWADGDSTDRTIEVKLRDDSAEEGLETIHVALLRESGGANIGVMQQTEIVIIDDEARYGNFAFSTSNYNTGEDSGNVTVTVERLNGSYGSATVDYATSNGSASAGTDYTATQGTLQFSPRQTRATFTVAILPDDFREGDEDIVLTLSNPSLAAGLASLSSAKIIIAGNDNESGDEEPEDNSGSDSGSGGSSSDSDNNDDDSGNSDSGGNSSDSSDGSATQDDDTSSSDSDSSSSGVGGGGGGSAGILMLGLMALSIALRRRLQRV